MASLCGLWARHWHRPGAPPRRTIVLPVHYCSAHRGNGHEKSIDLYCATGGFAQAPPTTAPAPAPTVTTPAVVPGAPVAPLTTGDEHFVVAQLEGNMAEIQAGQLALKNSQNQEVRQFAEKMITDHSYALKTLDEIAAIHHIQLPTTLTDQDRQMLDPLAKLDGPAFDRESACKYYRGSGRSWVVLPPGWLRATGQRRRSVSSISLTQLRQFGRRARAKGAEDCMLCDGSVNCGAKGGLAICE